MPTTCLHKSEIAPWQVVSHGVSQGKVIQNYNTGQKSDVFIIHDISSLSIFSFVLCCLRQLIRSWYFINDLSGSFIDAN